MGHPLTNIFPKDLNVLQSLLGVQMLHWRQYSLFTNCYLSSLKRIHNKSWISGFCVHCGYFNKENEVLGIPWSTISPKSPMFYKASMRFKNRIDENNKFSVNVVFSTKNKNQIYQGFRAFRLTVGISPKRTKYSAPLAQYLFQRCQCSTKPFWGSKLH